jgi:hypothetical protein
MFVMPQDTPDIQRFLIWRLKYSMWISRLMVCRHFGIAARHRSLGMESPLNRQYG